MKNLNNIIKAEKYRSPIIVTIWLLTTLFYWHSFELGTDLEADKYIREARHFINTGHISETRYWFYCVTIFIIVTSLKLGLGLYGAFIIQGIINLLAYLFFFKALKSIFTNKLVALCIIIYLLLFWPYQSWVVFLYTESIFYSAILILTATLILYKPVNMKNIFFISLALLLTIISRPLGILFTVGVYLYIFYYAQKLQKIIIAGGSVVLLVLGYVVINKIFSTLPDWHITQAFEEESIICDWPSSAPHPLLNLDKTGSPVYQLYYYVIHNFSHCIHFVGIKLQYFFFMTRNYFGRGHNYFLLLNIIPVYFLAAFSLFIKKENKRIAIFLLSSIFIYTLAISLQCDDYHNRFVLSIYPFFVVLAAISAEHFISLLFKNNKATTGA